MTTIEPPIKTEQRPAAPRRPAASKVHPLRVLAVIDGSEHTGRVIEYALNLGESGRPLEVILLAVVRTPADGRLRGYGSFKRNEVHGRLKEVMQERAVGSAARRFDQAQIAHKDRIEIGEPVDTILRVAREEGADIILLGDGPAGAVRRWLPKAIGLALATTAGQVAEQAEMPVVVVK
jgi:nucleotide-binding universal stress UspA family protein